jgi:hypothetical protein
LFIYVNNSQYTTIYIFDVHSSVFNTDDQVRNTLSDMEAIDTGEPGTITMSLGTWRMENAMCASPGGEYPRYPKWWEDLHPKRFTPKVGELYRRV